MCELPSHLASPCRYLCTLCILPVPLRPKGYITACGGSEVDASGGQPCALPAFPAPLHPLYPADTIEIPWAATSQ